MGMTAPSIAVAMRLGMSGRKSTISQTRAVAVVTRNLLSRAARPTPKSRAGSMTMVTRETTPVTSELSGQSAMNRFFLLLIVAFGLFCTRCNKATWAAAAQGASAGLSGASVAPQELMLFGGEGHKTYLGCLNCSQYASDSILNQYGPHGSPYSSDSIFNKYSEFGSKYSQYGACNPYATDPPVIVDNNGTFYGRLTMNQYHPQLGSG